MVAAEHLSAVVRPRVVTSAEERVPPHNLEAEAAVLSAVMVDSTALSKVVGFLQPPHFYSEAHRRIYEAALSLAGEGQPVDVVQVATELRDRDRLTQAGGMAYLTEVLNAAPAVANVVAYAETVREKWRARQIILLGQKLAATGYAGTPADELLPSAIAELARLQPTASSESPILYGEELGAPLANVEWLCHALKLAPGAHTLFAATSFSGKSLATEDIAIATTMGADAFGAFSCRRGAARILDFDGQGQRISQERLQRLARARGTEIIKLGKAIAYQRRPGFYIDEPGATERLLQLLDGVALCVIDSWRGATPSTDEWNRGQVQVVADRLETVSSKTGCTIAIVDHHVKPTRDGKSSRGAQHDVHGSSAKTETAQSHFAFSAKEGEKETSVRHVKERITGVTISPFGLRFEDVERDGDPRWGLRVAHVDREEMAAGGDDAELAETLRRMRAYLATNPVFQGSKKELRAAMRIGEAPFTAGYVHMIQSGELTQGGTYHERSFTWNRR